MEHIENLLKGGQNPTENWTIHELLRASFILFTYHGLCGLCLGMGLVPEQDIIQQMISLMGPEAL